MCEKCDNRRQEFIDTFKETMKEGVEAVEKYGSNKTKVTDPRFKLLIQLAQEEGEYTLSTEEREAMIDYVVELVYEVTAVNMVLAEYEATLAMISTLDGSETTH